jgi:hypothetical protein
MVYNLLLSWSLYCGYGSYLAIWLVQWPLMSQKRCLWLLRFGDNILTDTRLQLPKRTWVLVTERLSSGSGYEYLVCLGLALYQIVLTEYRGNPSLKAGQ